MGKQGVQPKKSVEEFMQRAFKGPPELNNREVAELLRARFGDELAVDVSTVGRRRRQWVANQQGGISIGDKEGAFVDNPPEQGVHPRGLGVNVKTDKEGWDIVPHLTASVTIPIRFYFEVLNKTDQVIRYVQLHAWVPNGLFWDPESYEAKHWFAHDFEEPPKEFQNYDFKEGRAARHVRWTARFTPDDGFALFPSDQSHQFPPLEVVGRPWGGLYSMPWKIEAPGVNPTVGGLLLCNGDRFKSRQTGQVLDKDRMATLDAELVAEYQAAKEQERKRIQEHYVS